MLGGAVIGVQVCQDMLASRAGRRRPVTDSVVFEAARTMAGAANVDVSMAPQAYVQSGRATVAANG
jgi:ABC-type uncharacterized transport system permease subunit